MRNTRVTASLVLVILLTLPFVSAGVSDTLGEEGSLNGLWPALEVTLRPDAESVVERVFVEPGAVGVGVAEASEHEEPTASECTVLAPQELTCDGADAHFGSFLRFTLSFGVESISNTEVHLIQIANGTPVFWYSCKVNQTVWLAMYLDGADCRQSGEAVFNDVANVRLHLSHLPAAGRLSVGHWAGRIETVQPETVES